MNCKLSFYYYLVKFFKLFCRDGQPAHMYVFYGCRNKSAIQELKKRKDVKITDEPNLKMWFEKKFGTSMPGHQSDQIVSVDLPEGCNVLKFIKPTKEQKEKH